MKKIDIKKIDRTIMIIATLVTIGLLVLILNFLFIFSSTLSALAIAMVVVGPIVLEYYRYKEGKEIEERFPDFLRDVAGNLRAGMTLPQAIMSTKSTNYGKLSPYVRKIAIDIDWGLAFDKVFLDFASKTTPVLRRTVSTVIEAQENGGDIAEIFDATGKTILEINKIRKERMSAVYNQITTGYIIFFVFLGVLVALEKYFIPGISSLSSPEIGLAGLQGLASLYKDTFAWLILIQGFFSGIVIGKMSEGRLIAGLKHCMVLMIIGYSILTIFV